MEKYELLPQQLILEGTCDDDVNLSNMVIDRFNQCTDQYLNEFPHHDVYRHNMIVEDKCSRHPHPDIK